MGSRLAPVVGAVLLAACAGGASSTSSPSISDVSPPLSESVTGTTEISAASDAPATTGMERSLDDLAWSRGVVEGESRGDMWSAVVGGPGFVAVGEDVSSEEGERPAVWVSTDGESWTQVHAEALDIWASMVSVTAGGPGLVAVGYVDEDQDPSGPESFDAAVWVSVDGYEWKLITESHFGGIYKQEMWGVTAGGPGLVAVGWDGDLVGAVPSPTDSDVEEDITQVSDVGVWLSEDGYSWWQAGGAALTEGQALVADQDGNYAVVVADTGVLIAGNYIEGGYIPAIWFSPDAEFWDLADVVRLPTESADNFTARTIAKGDSGYVVVGDRVEVSGERHDAVVWYSLDGRHWELIESDALGGEGVQEMLGVTAVESWFIAVGVDRASPSGTAIWVSPDGQTWDRSPLPGENTGAAELHQALFDGARLLVVGFEERDGQIQPVVWTAIIP